MKYFYIRNRGSLNRRLLELIGLTTKRDKMKDTSVIGNKGSGSKLSAVAALRLAIYTGITSVDENGRYLLEFDAEKVSVDGAAAHQVHYHYWLADPAVPEGARRHRFPSSMVLEGFPDWDQAIGADACRAFKLLREHVCNAYDEDKSFEWGECDTRAFAVPGEVTVYLGLHDDFRKIMAVPERYFKFLSSHVPLAVVAKAGSIWPKSDRLKTRQFLQGVLVGCEEQSMTSSLYDYSLNDKMLLSEERVIKSASAFSSGIAKLFCALTDVALCASILKGVAEGQGRVELQAMGDVYNKSSVSAEAKAAWLAAARATFGEKIALRGENEVANSDAQQMYGHRVLTGLDGELARFLAKVGVPSADDVFPKNGEERIRAIPFADFDAASQERFRLAYRIFAARFPERAGFPIWFFEAKDEAMRAMVGFAGEGAQCFREIWIQAKTPLSADASGDVAAAIPSPYALPTLTSLLISLLHESRHCETRLYDKDRGFQSATENDLLREILRQTAIRADGVRVPGLAAPPQEPTFGTVRDGRAFREADADVHDVQELELTFEESASFDEALRQLDIMLERPLSEK